jgi:hypothetical protein
MAIRILYVGKEQVWRYRAAENGPPIVADKHEKAAPHPGEPLSHSIYQKLTGQAHIVYRKTFMVVDYSSSSPPVQLSLLHP